VQTRAALVNLGWATSNAPRLLAYRAALNDPAPPQRRLLRQYLRDNAGTDFGRRHEFARLRGYADFRAAVPVSTYDDYAPFIDRIAAGEANVLTAQPVTRLVPSGGSTRAQKLIPYTQRLHEEFNAGIGPWICDLFRNDPRLIGGPAYWSVSPASQPPAGASASAVPVGFDDDTAYVGGAWRHLIGAAFAVPSAVRHAPSVDCFRYVTLLCLLRAADLRLVSVWHPSFLSLLLDSLPASFYALVRDVAEGTCTPPDRLPPDLASALRGRADPRRAAALSRVGPDDCAATWPRLRLISCWADAHAALHLDGLRQRFPRVTIQPKGLLATEAFVSLPFAGLHPLAVRSHFFEFLDDSDDARLAHELQVGAEYRVVVTTGGGLYRYALQDRVRVDGYVGRTPSVRFVGKEDHVSDLFGEKLSEGFVGAAIRRLFDRRGLRPRFALLAPESDGSQTRYALFLELPDAPADLAAELDEALSQNPHYQYCRALGQLAPPRVAPLRCDGYAAYAAECHRRGRCLGDIKASPLSRHDGWADVFARGNPA
jgi:hypothetical protein